MYAHFSWLHVVWMGIGGGFGAAMRYCISTVVNHISATFPWGTLLVNLSGAALLGGIAAYFNDYAYSAAFFFWEIGVLSGYTTMSAVAVETLYLLRQRRYSLAVLYTLVSLIGVVIALVLGFRLGGLLL